MVGGGERERREKLFYFMNSTRPFQIAFRWPNGCQVKSVQCCSKEYKGTLCLC